MTDSRLGSDAPPASELVLPTSFRMTLRGALHATSTLPTSQPERADTVLLRPTWADWTEALHAQMNDDAVLFREIETPLEEAIEGLRRGSPLVTFRPTTGWLALLEVDGRRVRVARAGEPTVLLSKHEIAKVLSVASSPAEAADIPDSAGTIRWVGLESTLFPNEATRQRSPHPVPRGRPFNRLLEIIHPERADVLAIILFAAFSGLLSLAIPVAVQQLVNTVAFGGLVQPIVVVALLLAAGLAIAGCMYAFQAYLAEILQQRVFVRACLDLAHRLPRIDEAVFEERSMPAYVNRFFDLVTIQKTGARLLVEGSGVVLQTVTGLLVLSFYHPLMLALSIFLFATMAMVAVWFGRSAPDGAIRESAAKYEIAAWMEELVRHPNVFRTTAARGRAETRTDELVTAWIGARRDHYRVVFRQFLAALSLQVVVNTGLLALGGYLVVAGELTLGQLVASEIIVASVVASFARLAKHFESFYDLLAAVDKVSGLFDLPLERPHLGGNQIDATATAPGPLVCRGLSVVGASGTGLRALTMEIPAGEKVELRSATPELRSALFDALSGTGKIESGYLTLAGRDLRDQSPQAVRDQIRLIRSPQIVPGTIADNLMMGHPEATLEAVEHALEVVGLLHRIRELPKGLNTEINDRGGPLGWTGALQLEMARTIMARPAVILLDLQALGCDEMEVARAAAALAEPDAPWTLLAAPLTSTCGLAFARQIDLDAAALRPTDASPSDTASPTKD